MVKCSFIMVAFFLHAQAATAQNGRKVLSPDFSFGLSFNADTNDPTFSGSLRLMGQMGIPSDVFNLSLGLGYRGFFDRRAPEEFLKNRSFSDYMLYSHEDGSTKKVRPMGGQIIIPAELMLNAYGIKEDLWIFVGCGAELGLRLYQSHRYGDYYGAHTMNSTSLNVYPMAGLQFDLEEAFVNLSLYWRHYITRPLNGEEIKIDKFEAKDFFGFQVGVAF